MEEVRRADAMTTRAILAWALPIVALLSCAGFAEHSTVVVRNLSPAGAFEVENQGPDVELAWAVAVQRYTDGQWTDSVTDLALAETCGQAPESGCVRLAHSAKIRPERWNGLSCGSQCPAACRANVYLGPGRFRFVVSSCDRQQKFLGSAFEMPARGESK